MHALVFHFSEHIQMTFNLDFHQFFSEEIVFNILSLELKRKTHRQYILKSIDTPSKSEKLGAINSQN